MYVITVIPIARSSFKEHLSFFSKKSLPEGAVIEVSVRGRATPALVTAVKEAREEKMSLRDSSFTLKKVMSKTVKKLFSSKTIEALKETARYHAAGMGEIIAHFSPHTILNATTPFKEAGEPRHEGETTSDTLALQAEYEERVRMYRNLAREAFARAESVFILAPTIPEAERLYEKLHRGIDERVLVMTSASSKKSITAAWKRALEDTEPLLLIGTHSFITIPRRDIGAFVVEREGARAYVSRERGAFDARIAAEYIAKKSGARFIVADFPLRIRTQAQLHAGTVEEMVRLQTSAQSMAQVRVVDARTKKDGELDGGSVVALTLRRKKFSVFTDTARMAIENELRRGGRVFLYASRKGLAPLTVCNDCGTPVTDPATGTPMTLHKTESGNVFLSYRSGAIVPANISCAQCGGWNLVSLGIGVERVIEEAEKLFPDTTIFSLTVDSAPTHAKAQKIQKYFFNTPGSILVGTDRALPYLEEPVELSVVISIDSLLSISAWRAHEYTLATLFYLRDRAQDMLLVQTRLIENAVMKAVALGNPTDFIRDELVERKTYQYPPFATFIGLAWAGGERGVAKVTEEIKEHLKGLDVVGPLPAHQIGRNRYQARAVIRLERGGWPNDMLVRTLKALPREVAITIDPDEIV